MPEELLDGSQSQRSRVWLAAVLKIVEERRVQRRGQKEVGASRSELVVKLAVAGRVMAGESSVSNWRGKSQTRRMKSSLVSLVAGELAIG